ncbi:regulation of nuclear pre-mRNA domain-containing protein 1B-like isoform X2 [Telopea speciosissima]|uniref:regulation of nuclear pre-mRNA domain-containing protein 1B-like isoform X2 n=1 Tax=Telopea speciosissima TaxID=54955 RepID=UPI001CC411CD|nr:regulation of nuclear pre-mRNA domain-containing protein 1B-like isoform X2 [Telopea speciosissima]
MNSVFSEQILADKLSKLNNTQQCIETLSHWCIFHQKKADLVVATWDKQFQSSENSQKIPFLYLANDILQNSKRKGNEFVSEFWKVLPAAIKDVYENCEDRGKTVVSRLVNIWEERRVFGSQAQGLKDLMLGEESLPPLEFGRKRSRSVRIIRRDSRSIRTKLAIGGTTEKIVSAFHSVLSEHSNEDAEMSKCKSVVKLLRKMEKDVDMACSKVGSDPKRTSLANEVEEEENLLKQSIEKLKSFEETRVALVSQLREALHEQESELENVRTQLQVAQAQVEEAINMRKRLRGEKIEAPPKKSAAEIAAEVADKLAASSSSQYIMSSVLSTFAAEAAKNAGLTTSCTPSNSFSSAPVASFTDTRLKLEKPMPVADSNYFVAVPSQQLSSSYTQQLASQYQTALVHQPLIQSQASSAQTQYHILPNNPSQQYVQPSGGVTSGLAYGYGGFPPLPPGPPPPPPPPLPTRLATPLLAQQMQINQTQQQPMQLIQQPTVQQQMPLIQQQPPVPPSFRPLQPPGMMYYIHPNQQPQ